MLQTPRPIPAPRSDILNLQDKTDGAALRIFSGRRPPIIGATPNNFFAGIGGAKETGRLLAILALPRAAYQQSRPVTLSFPTLPETRALATGIASWYDVVGKD